MKPEPHLSLSRIFLHNWHRFSHHLIEVEDSLYLAGHNGSGKSSVLDALQVVLLADLTRVRFNSSAQEKSDRSLDTYVRGKIGETHWLRPGNTVAFIALEFSTRQKALAVTVGVCIEARHDQGAERTYFILNEGFQEALFFSSGLPLTRRELRKLLRGRRGGQAYDEVREYQTDLLDRLGGLNPRFFDLFIKALRFEPIRDIAGFVENWLLEKKQIHLETLQNVRENLQALQASAERVEKQLRQLDAVLAGQREVLRLIALGEQYKVLAALLRAEDALRRVRRLQEHVAGKQVELDSLGARRDTVRAALDGAEAALEAAQQRWRESDVARQKESLERDIQRLAQEAESIRARWRAVVTDLGRQVDSLRPLVGTPALQPDETAAMSLFMQLVGALRLEQPPRPELAGALESAALALELAQERAREARVRLVDRASALQIQQAELESEIRELQEKGQVRYGNNVQQMRALLAAEGVDASPLCELIDVADPRWQDAVEAMLGARRFNLVVRPSQFDAAVSVVERARAQQHVYDVGVLDLAKVAKEARPPQPGSLANQVTTDSPALRAYVDTVLGDLITCETAATLRRYRRAVTPEVVVYSEWTVRAINPKQYSPHFIGKQAIQSQIAARQRDLDEVKREAASVAPQVRDLEATLKLLNRQKELAALRERLNARLDEGPLREELAQLQLQLDSLDLSSVEALQAEIARLKRLVAQHRDEERTLIEDIATARSELQTQQNNLATAEAVRRERADEAAAARERYPEAVTAAEEQFAHRSTTPEIEKEIRNVEAATERFRTQTDNAHAELTRLATAYNTVFTFGGNPTDPRDDGYAREQQRLAETDLPRYKAEIEAASRQAETELREHVLHTLHEQIEGAKRELNRINTALAGLEFHNEKYAFRYERNDDVREFYELITTEFGAGSLFESEFYRQHQATFDLFYEQLTRKPMSEADRREQDRLTDYRHYLSYDIEVLNTASEQKSRLSRIMNQTSGGETQTPFYLTIAASFVQLYSVYEHSRRPVVRLVAFDEAFSKMDQERIGSTLDLFQRFDLQIITATPLERCEYLVPKMCTNLVLTAVKDTVHIEPYHNYAARLNHG